jgi:hypothetical protein
MGTSTQVNGKTTRSTVTVFIFTVMVLDMKGIGRMTINKDTDFKNRPMAVNMMVTTSKVRRAVKGLTHEPTGAIIKVIGSTII